MESLRITKVDETAVNDGTWTSYRGVKLKIARANNTKFKNVFLRLSKPYQKQIAKQQVTPDDEDTYRDILCRSLAQSVLLDWDNFSIGGNKIEYNEDNAYSLLMNDADCLDFVMEFSRDVENYIKAEEEASTGKS